jgi:hypothetical protein
MPQPVPKLGIGHDPEAFPSTAKFNLTSDNSEILIIWHLGRVVARLGSFAFYQKKASSLKQEDL